MATDSQSSLPVSVLETCRVSHLLAKAKSNFQCMSIFEPDEDFPMKFGMGPNALHLYILPTLQPETDNTHPGDFASSLGFQVVAQASNPNPYRITDLMSKNPCMISLTNIIKNRVSKWKVDDKSTWQLNSREVPESFRKIDCTKPIDEQDPHVIEFSRDCSLRLYTEVLSVLPEPSEWEEEYQNLVEPEKKTVRDCAFELDITNVASERERSQKFDAC